MKRAVAVGSAVYLRRPSRRDATEFVAAARRSREVHGRWVQPATDESTYRRWIARGERDDIEQFLVASRSDDSLAGFINLNNIILGNLRTAFLGYGAFVPHVGTGAMSAGLALVLSVAFTQLGLHRLEANIQPDNEASRALVRRAGFRLEGYSPDYLRIQGVWQDHERWAILESEWRAAQRAKAAR